jgi:hypothetical protein
MRAKPSTMLEPVRTALGQMWLAAFVNRVRSSSVILMETDRLRLGVMQPSSVRHPFRSRNTMNSMHLKYPLRAISLCYGFRTRE